MVLFPPYKEKRNPSPFRLKFLPRNLKMCQPSFRTKPPKSCHLGNEVRRKAGSVSDPNSRKTYDFCTVSDKVVAVRWVVVGFSLATVTAPTNHRQSGQGML